MAQRSRAGEMRRFLGAAAVVVGIALLGAVAPVVTEHLPNYQDLAQRFLPPGSPGYLLGTDDLGRDVLARAVWSIRSAMLTGTVAVGLGLSIGVVLGIVAAVGGRVVDRGLMIAADAVFAFPTVLLAIAVVAGFGYGSVQVTATIGIVFGPVFMRLVRAESRSILSELYVTASRSLGTPTRRIIGIHVLPGILPQLSVQSGALFAVAIGIEAGLSYLGLGTQPPGPSWGVMLRDAQTSMFRAPWLAIVPGVFLTTTVFALQHAADRLAVFLRTRA